MEYKTVWQLAILEKNVDYENWELIQPFVFHPNDPDIQFENSEYPIVKYIRQYREIELLYSLRTVQEFCSSNYSYPLKEIMVNGLKKEIQNWIENDVSHEQQDEVQRIYATSIEKLKDDYLY